MHTPPGYVTYRGPSLIDGSPIVVIVNTITEGSNSKLTKIKSRSMAQVWILRSDMPPNVAIKAGHDIAVCGACPFAKDQGCFVDMRPLVSVWHALERGSYTEATPEGVAKIIGEAIAAGRCSGVRFGAYGDPGAVPFAVLGPLAAVVDAHGATRTGYTHAWGPYAVPGFVADVRLRTIAMASGHTARDEREARVAGYRSFISTPTVETPIPNSAPCPASKEAGYRKTCDDCGACSGVRGMADRRASMRIAVHGSAYKVSRSVAAIRRVEAAQAAR